MWQLHKTDGNALQSADKLQTFTAYQLHGAETELSSVILLLEAHVANVVGCVTVMTSD